MTDSELWNMCYMWSRRMKDGYGVSKDDLAVEMWLECKKAIPRYKPGHGTVLKTWLYIYARGAVAKAYMRGTMFGRQGEQNGAQKEMYSIDVCGDVPQDTNVVDDACVSAIIETLPPHLAKRLRGYVFEGKSLGDGANRGAKKRIVAEIAEIQQRLKPLMTGA